ncbi:ribosomal protein L24p/L26e, archaeal/eukaryotic [Caldisphaera lagunensis DSM 15908]|uniref:Large ribosomal subunit protein uL24 n=1 Tax=Caldisphaera lagunensis (strain DSM 15908 / JCM 11604 / ANMR 0165 / IC-154) TaxID=1056495 RepID=L0AD86_CALLD|nr:50S ribosomal protein L24 [Caldisphaera lagunensis]AFZ71087.1 ribosomal protein L24p/L26e, archaeal/eukaryotic [Caldisphaera lagunensis DSM 15908]
MISSSIPKKQRKYLFNMPLHLRHKLVTVKLSKELRNKFGIRNLPVKVGDKVRVVKGTHKGKTGKVTEVDLKRLFVKIEGIKRKKADGTEIPVKIRPWNLEIIDLDLKDEERKKIVQRRGGKMQETQSEFAKAQESSEEKSTEEKEVKTNG